MNIEEMNRSSQGHSVVPAIAWREKGRGIGVLERSKQMRVKIQGTGRATTNVLARVTAGREMEGRENGRGWG